MLTLSEIKNPAASNYSDLFKAAYGSRPQNVTFVSEEDFAQDYDFLCEQLDRMLERQEKLHAIAISDFELRLNETMFVTKNMDRTDAIRIVVQAEGLEEAVQWYGYSALEFELGLPYGYIKNSLI